jgi:hypothetical protein
LYFFFEGVDDEEEEKEELDLSEGVRLHGELGK